MSSRIIRSQGGSLVLQDYLLSMFLTELIAPSKELYLISPFLSNSPIADNRHQQYTALIPFATGTRIFLSDFLAALAWKGTAVRIICDPERPEVQSLLTTLQDIVEFRKLENNHEKCLVSENVYLSGSMNFTYRGIYVNREVVRVTSEPSKVSEALLSARQRWEEASAL